MVGAVAAYTGNGAYCFSNGLHMALLTAVADPSTLPEPGFLECLTGMAFGRAYFPSWPGLSPCAPGWSPEEHGLERAIEALGWRCATWYGGSAEEALDRLREGLLHGPALIGPIDFGHLSYFRNSGGMAGFDHYVVGLSFAEDGLVLHDPAGLPYAVLPLPDLLEAWRADRIGYKRGPYTLRIDFQQEGSPTRREMIGQTLPLARAHVRNDADGPRRYGGHRALSQLAAALRNERSEALERNLLVFALPTAARRTVDAARFLAEAGLNDAARLMGDEAVLWGRACSCASRGQWTAVAAIADQLASTEQELASAF